jgi:hypothetical protein
MDKKKIKIDWRDKPSPYDLSQRPTRKRVQWVDWHDKPSPYDLNNAPSWDEKARFLRDSDDR